MSSKANRKSNHAATARFSRRDSLVILAGAFSLPALHGQTVPRALPEAPFGKEAGWRPLLNGNSLSGWHAIPGWRGDPNRLHEWFTTSAVSVSSQEAANKLVAAPGAGPILMNGTESRTSNLVSDESFGDLEVYLEFLLARGSNSGVYLHGLYEVQILDSFGKPAPLTTADSGAIYQRWDGGKGFEGSPPLVNAARPPGQWQSFRILFQSPRFQGDRKIRDAEFLQVTYNGAVVQRGYRCTGPTRSGLEIPEAPRNPIMLQGDHGPVAFRNLYVRAPRGSTAKPGATKSMQANG